MIDLDLIKKTTSSIISSLDNRTQVNQSFYQLNNILPADICNKLQQYIVNCENWQEPELEFYKKGRRKINWEPDSVIEELHTAFEQTTQEINKIFPCQQTHNFTGISLWEDTEGYNFNWHTDNEILSCALHIYLFDCPQEFGTIFKINDIDHELPFVHNTGYIINQTIRPMILHKTSRTMPDKIKRYSLYASWSLTEKLPG